MAGTGSQNLPVEATTLAQPPPAGGHGLFLSGGRARRVLAATILGSALAFIDSSAVNVALPSIAGGLGAGVAALQWVVDGYMLFLGALVLLGGGLGDRWGRVRVFTAGIAVFSAASLACGAAPGPGALVAARMAQGVGAALLVPNSMAILGAAFPPAQRARAVGTWAGAGALTAMIGPVLGGWLVDAVSWRAIFLINLPLAALAALLIRGTPDQPGVTAGHDWTGAALAVAGLGALTYGLIALSSAGPLGAAAVVAGAALLAAFTAWEAKAATPMLPLAIFRSAAFAGATVLTFLLYAGLGAVMFFLPFALIGGHGLSATMAGASLLPFALMMGGLSRKAGRLADAGHARAMLVAGPLLAAGGFALLGWLVPMSAWGVLPGMALVGLGMTASIAPLGSVVLGSVPPERIGIASGVNNATARLAGLLAVAALGLVAGPDLGGSFRVVAAAAAAAAAGASAAAALTVRLG